MLAEFIRRVVKGIPKRDCRVCGEKNSVTEIKCEQTKNRMEVCWECGNY